MGLDESVRPINIGKSLFIVRYEIIQSRAKVTVCFIKKIFRVIRFCFVILIAMENPPAVFFVPPARRPGLISIYSLGREASG